MTTKIAPNPLIGNLRSGSALPATPDREVARIIESVESKVALFGAEGEKTVSLFERLVGCSRLGHTLFGSKPLTDVFVRTDRHSKPNDITPDLTEWQGWGRTYKHFQNGAIVFHESGHTLLARSDDRVAEEPRAEVLFINIPALNRVVDGNASVFRRVLGPEADHDTVFNHLISAPSLNRIFDGDLVATGLVLGYGLANAVAYKRRQELTELGAANMLGSNVHWTRRTSDLLSPYPSPAAELSDINLAFTRSSELQNARYKDCHLIADRFLALEDHPETVAIRESADRTVLLMQQIERNFGRRGLACYGLGAMMGAVRAVP